MRLDTTTSSPILYWDRKNQREEVEQVYGNEWIQRIYGTRQGQFWVDHLLSRKWLSKIYGIYQSSRLSRHKIESFVRDFKIQMGEYEPGPFNSFNDFFIRKFRPGARPFSEKTDEMPAFAEARYFAFNEISLAEKFPVKGQNLTALDLLGDSEKAKPFVGGPLLLARLCPTDYHRFHFPDSGEVLERYRIHGKLHSVNPVALQYKSEIFVTNERQISILQTDHFGKLAYIEVGALCVGKIVETHSKWKKFSRGDEKGYFLFGGSTVIVLGENGKWVPDTDLVKRTKAGQEVFVRLGERVASVSI